MIDGQLLSCPNCLQIGKKQILGKILTNGDFLVLRFHHGTTLIKGTVYTISCGCGWLANISQGTVVTQQALQV
jgi:hypothetical protein